MLARLAMEGYCKLAQEEYGNALSRCIGVCRERGLRTEKERMKDELGVRIKALRDRDRDGEPVEDAPARYGAFLVETADWLDELARSLACAVPAEE